MVLFSLDLWEIFFLATLGFELGTSAFLILLPLCHINFWFSPLTISGLWCRGIGGGIVLIGPVRDFLFGHTGVHSTTVPRQLLVFTSDNFRYLTLVQRDWWWYCSHWTCGKFSFWPHQGLNEGPLVL